MNESTTPTVGWKTAERDALREMVDRFTKKEIVPFLADWEKDGALPRSLHKKAAAVGLLELGVPERAGGSGEYLDFLIANEQIILSGGSTGLLSALMTHSISTPHIVADGGDHLIDKYVRPTLAGELIGSLGVTEPGTGSDVSAISTKAVRDGDEYVVTGAKTFITSGTRADFVTTAVRTGGDGHRGISLLVIDTASPGFRVATKLDKMGWLCSDTAELTFDEVRVPAHNVVGAEGSGFGQIMRRFESERLLMAVQAVATAQRSLGLTVEWAQNRITFGQPLSSRQVIRHRIAVMTRQLQSARSYVRDVVSRWSAGENVGAEVAMAKNTAVFTCDAVVDEAVQIHGGMGFMRESEVERHYRDARVLGIGGGTNEMMNEIIAKKLLDR